MYTPEFTKAVVTQRSHTYAAEAARHRLLAALRCCRPSFLAEVATRIRGRFAPMPAQQCSTT
jgi:hypothetical protein